jgi:hypothetical protein
VVKLVMRTTKATKRGKPNGTDDNRTGENKQIFTGTGDKFFSSVPLRHITDVMLSAVGKGFSGKTTEMSAYSANHRTTISHFLRQGKWDSERLGEELSQRSFSHIAKKAEDWNTPIFISVDDTVNPKKRHSSMAKRPMEGTAFHYSHLLGKKVWGHQALAALIGTGETTLCYQLERCGRREGGKIEAVKEIANSLPMAQRVSYALMDSWYTCPAVIDAFASKGFHTIGALKSNRIIYPKGIRISISDFAAEYIKETDANLVTVGKKRFWVYRYEGNLNGVHNAAVLITYPENAFGKADALRAFLCTDASLDTSVILEYYRNRWKIEVFFKQQKNLLGFSGYQIRSQVGIDRLWILLSLVSFYCVVGGKQSLPLGDGVRSLRLNILIDIAHSYYEAGRMGIPFDSLSFVA